MPTGSKDAADMSKGPETSSSSSITKNTENFENELMPPKRPPLPLQLNQDLNILNNLIEDTDSKTPVNIDISLSESNKSLTSVSEDVPPKVHPRRKSSADKVALKPALLSPGSDRSSITSADMSELNETTSTLSTSKSESMLVDGEQKISVKERKQMFNRMASESDVLSANKKGSFNPHVSLINICILYFKAVVSNFALEFYKNNLLIM